MNATLFFGTFESVEAAGLALSLMVVCGCVLVVLAMSIVDSRRHKKLMRELDAMARPLFAQQRKCVEVAK